MRRGYAGPPIFLALALTVSPLGGRGLVAAVPQENGARLNDGGSSNTPTSGAGVDPIVALADSLLAEDLPLSASRLLAAELAVSGPAASPAAILGAARALDRARSWRTVLRLLAERPWLDSLEGGEGRLLQARAELETGAPTAALEHFDAYLAAPGEDEDPTRRVAALVGRARALERLGRDTAAADSWLMAAESEPAVSHWLRLSALQALGRAGQPDRAVTVSRALREQRAIPSDSVYVELGRAAFVAGDTARGLAFADSLSVRGRAQLAGAWLLPALLERGDTAAAIRAARKALEIRRADERVGEVYIALDTSLAALRLVAESDLDAGRTRRAVELRERVLERSPDADHATDRLALAEAWFRRGRYSDVRRVLSPWLDADTATTIPGDSYGLEAAALFLAGRAWYRQGRRDEAMELWERVADMRGARDGAYASFLIGDILHDRGDLEGAAEAYLATVDRHPRSGYAGTALFRLGMLALLHDKPEEAFEHFDRYRRRSPGGNWYHASIYWSARSLEAAGDTASANERFREAVARDPLGYYGVLSAAALGIDAWDEVPRRSMAPLTEPRSADSAMVARMDLLRELGWRNRGIRELSTRDRIGESESVRLALALFLNERGWTWQGTALASAVRTSGSGEWTDDLLRGVYPLIYDGALALEADRHRLDAALVAAIVRRESQFDREVSSHAGAMGLMQVLPRTGAELARRNGMAEFNSDQLRVAEVNLSLGTLYLRELLDRNGGSLVPALISYNAGPHRYARWRDFPEFSADAELMVERIPFRETRIYVKTITAYRHIYRRLWGLGTSSVDVPLGDR